MTAEHWETATMAAIAESRRVLSASAWPPAAQTFSAVADELRPVIYQVAEMAEHEPDNLRLIAEYVHGLFEREPLRSSPFWEPQRAVLGLLQLCLVNALVRVDAMAAEERATLLPAYHRAAIAEVVAAFDPTYDVASPTIHEEAATTTPPAPEMTDADILALL